jgi:hypothetical protein
MFMATCKFWQRLLLGPVALVLSACVSYSGSGLKPGVASLAEVTSAMGQPAMVWNNPDGSKQLAYPRGPAGTHTFMVQLGPDQVLKNIDNVLRYKYFAQIVPGKTTQEDILRLLGPSTPQWSSYYKARDELVWEWLYCDEHGYETKFDVLFDGMNGPVRTTMSRPNYKGADGAVPPCGQWILPAGQ